ncbi:MAG: 50S ribosomal protein L9 [Firmicutes bacterium]|nr:50S ribosomal protein L9 [Bacillota bacterium]
MKVVLRRDVKDLGKQGELVEVAEGYARNFLLPRGLAVPATEGHLKEVEHERRTVIDKQRREEVQADHLASLIKNQVLLLKVRAGEGGKLFGSVTANDIASGLRESLGIDIDRRKVELEEPFKALGNYTVPIRVHPGKVVALRVRVVQEAKETGG